MSIKTYVNNENLSATLYNIKQDSIYTDADSKSWQLRYYSKDNAVISPNMHFCSITDFGNATTAVGEKEYKLFAGVYLGGNGVYATADGTTWEKIELPSAINNLTIHGLAYVNGKYVLANWTASYGCKLFVGDALDADDSHWRGPVEVHSAGTEWLFLMPGTDIKSIDSDRCVIFNNFDDDRGGKYHGGLCIVSGMLDGGTLTAIPVNTLTDKRIRSFEKISDSLYIICTKTSGLYKATSIKADTEWQRIEVTKNTVADQQWQWLFVKQFQEQNIIFACGDGGNQTVRTDIWYSNDGAATWQRAKFTNIDSDSVIFGINCILRTSDNSFIAIGQKNSDIFIFTSQDGMTWKFENKYVRTGSIAKDFDDGVITTAAGIINDKIYFSDCTKTVCIAPFAKAELATADNIDSMVASKGYLNAAGFNAQLTSDASKATINGVVDANLATKNYLNVDSFNSQLTSDTSKVVIGGVVDEKLNKDIKLSSLYSDADNKVWRQDKLYNYTERQDIATANFSPAAITSLGEGAAAVGEGQYKLFAGKAGDAGLYASADGLTWEQINLPTIAGVDLNALTYSVIAYVNRKYVLTSKDGKYYYTTELSSDATKWCSEAKQLFGGNGYYTNIIQTNPIAVIDDNKFVVYGSSDKNKCCVVSNFTDLSITGPDGKKVWNIAKITDSLYLIATNGGVFKSSIISTSSSDWSLVSVTGNGISNSWTWQEIFYDSENNVIYVGGDGGDYADSDPTRKIDIWYSTDTCDTFRHANFIDRLMSELRGIGKIFKCYNENNLQVLVAMTASKQNYVQIYTSEDGVNWRTNNICTYSSDNADWLRNSTLCNDNCTVVCYDGIKLATFKTYAYQKKEIATVEYADAQVATRTTQAQVNTTVAAAVANCITNDNFKNALSAEANAPSLYSLLNAPMADPDDKSAAFTFTEDASLKEDKYSELNGAVMPILSIFTSVDAAVYDTIVLNSITYKAHIDTAKQIPENAIFKILDPSNAVLGTSRCTHISVATDQYVDIIFDNPALIPSNDAYVKLIAYNENGATTVSKFGCKVREHISSTAYGVYQSGDINTVHADSNVWNAILSASYFGTNKTTCIQKIIEQITDPRTNTIVTYTAASGLAPKTIKKVGTLAQTDLLSN